MKQETVTLQKDGDYRLSYLKTKIYFFFECTAQENGHSYSPSFHRNDQLVRLVESGKDTFYKIIVVHGQKIVHDLSEVTAIHRLLFSQLVVNEQQCFQFVVGEMCLVSDTLYDRPETFQTSKFFL